MRKVVIMGLNSLKAGDTQVIGKFELDYLPSETQTFYMGGEPRIVIGVTHKLVRKGEFEKTEPSELKSNMVTQEVTILLATKEQFNMLKMQNAGNSHLPVI